MSEVAASPSSRPHCDTCSAVCCRLTVLLGPEDRIPSHLTAELSGGQPVMARDEQGWCVALNHAQMSCSIYEDRPTICRRFTMGGPYCRDVRKTYLSQLRAGIPLTQYG